MAPGKKGSSSGAHGPSSRRGGGGTAHEASSRRGGGGAGTGLPAGHSRQVRTGLSNADLVAAAISASGHATAGGHSLVPVALESV